MTTLKHVLRRLRLPLTILLLLCMTGCMQNLIREDAAKERLPHIDPEQGAQRTMQITLYFRLHNEALLTPVYRNITAETRESMEWLVLNSLLTGPEGEETLLDPVIPAGTKLLAAQRNGEQVNVTLSREFISEEINMRSREEMQLRQRLAVYAIVNSLCSLRGVNSVQILVDTDGSGTGVAVPTFLLGFKEGEIATQTVGPLKKNAAMTVMPQTPASLALTHLCAQQYEQAYLLFASGDATSPKPGLEEFILQLQEETRITAFEAKGFTINDNGTYTVTLDLAWVTPDGTQHDVKAALVVVRPEQNMQLLDYHSLLQAMRAGQ